MAEVRASLGDWLHARAPPLVDDRARSDTDMRQSRREHVNDK